MSGVSEKVKSTLYCNYFGLALNSFICVLYFLISYPMRTAPHAPVSSSNPLFGTYLRPMYDVHTLGERSSVSFKWFFFMFCGCNVMKCYATKLTSINIYTALHF